MRFSVLTLLLPLLLPFASRADERVPCGTVDSLEITSLTRTKVTAFLHTSLPDAAEGGRQTFTGEIAVANTPLPLGPALTAMVQPGPRGHSVVLLVDLDLAKIPEALLARREAERKIVSAKCRNQHAESVRSPEFLRSRFLLAPNSSAD